MKFTTLLECSQVLKCHDSVDSAGSAYVGADLEEEGCHVFG